MPIRNFWRLPRTRGPYWKTDRLHCGAAMADRSNELKIARRFSIFIPEGEALFYLIGVTRERLTGLEQGLDDLELPAPETLLREDFIFSA